MKLEIAGEEMLEASLETVWKTLNDPECLTHCIPGCKAMNALGPDDYRIEMQLKVASVGGSFNGSIALSDKEQPSRCRITVSGSGSLGHGNGTAEFALVSIGAATTRLTYAGQGEIGGLVAGVGQRVLKGVAKHLTGRFFIGLRQVLSQPASAP